MITTTEKTAPITVLANPEVLDQIVIDTMIKELNELEKNPVNGWNLTYPTLFNTLNTTTGELCAKLGCTIPYLFIDFQGTQRHQACAHLMTDGSKQLHIGIDFLRECLLSQPHENRQKAYSAFRWTIAHELSHFCDPKFTLFGRLFLARRFLNNVAIGGFLGGIVGLMGQPQAWNNVRLLVIASGLFLILKGVASIFMHRKFEYFADAKSVGVIDDVDLNDIKDTLTKMTAAIRDCIHSSYENSPSYFLKLFAWGYRKFKLAQIFLLHPSINKRIARMKAGIGNSVGG
jgi:hypothetical protein